LCDPSFRECVLASFRYFLFAYRPAAAIHS
jgi:hypothetical protein